MNLAAYLSMVSNTGDYQNPQAAHLKAIINISTLNNVYVMELAH
jgi:hypothetical protein